MSAATDSRDPVESALDSASEHLERELTELVADRRRQLAMLDLRLPDDARQAIEQRLATIDSGISGLIMTWHTAGGRVRFVSTDALAPTLAAASGQAAPRSHPAPLNTPRIITRRTPTPQQQPQGPPATATALHELKQVAENGALHQSPTSDPNWRQAFVELLRSLGPGATDAQEADRLEQAAMSTDAWFGWPAHVQKHLIGMIATRMRTLQDAGRVEENRFKHAFSALTGFSKREKPGFVFGLSRNHSPHGESWFEDSERHREHLLALLPEPDQDVPSHSKLLTDLRFLTSELEDAPAQMQETLIDQAVRTTARALDSGLDGRDVRLVKATTPIAEHLVGPHFRRLRRAIRDAQASALESEDAPAPTMPRGWRWWDHTRGKRVLLLGGSPRETSRKRMQAAFEMQKLEWVQSLGNRKELQIVRERIRSGEVELLILLGSFIGHDADQILLPACRETTTPWVHVDHGYGITRTQHAIERFLEPTEVPARVQGAQGQTVPV